MKGVFFMSDAKGKLFETNEKFPQTEYWNDSCAVKELEYAIDRGATGATTNPVIVGNVLNQEMDLWEDTLVKWIDEMPDATEEEVAWRLIEQMAVRGAKLLNPVYEKTNHKKGKISIQTNAKLYRNADAMAEQAIGFGDLAPNIMVKMPTSAAGIKAFEEATFAGISINATVSFTVAQAVAVAEAVERGLIRREEAGLSNENITPVCTIMVGRTDDWVKEAVKRDNLCLDPCALEYAGVAAFKNAYKIYQERGYKTRLLAAAYRNYFHWSEFIGGDVVLTITQPWQEKINGSDVEVKERMSRPVPEKYLNELKKIPDFIMAYEEDGLKPEEFVHYGAFVKTISQFLGGYESLLGVIRKLMVGDPIRK